MEKRVKILWQDRWKDGKQYALLRWTENRKREKEALGYQSLQDAERLRAEKEARLTLGLPTLTATSGPYTVDTGIRAYLEELPRLPGGDGHKRSETDRCVALGKAIGARSMETLTDTDLKRMVRVWQDEITPQKKPLSRATAAQRLHCLKRIYKLCRSSGHIQALPPDTSRVLKGWPKDARPPRRLTEVEIKGLVEAAERRPRTRRQPWADQCARLITFLAWCPRRPVAIFELRRKDCTRALDLTLPRGEVLIDFRRDKGGENRGRGPITEPALAVLRQQLALLPDDPEVLVWANEAGNPWDAKEFGSLLHRVADRAGIPDVRPYDLRKFGVYKVCEALKFNLRAAIRFTGHLDPMTLQRNYLFDQERDATAAAGEIGWKAT